MLAGRMEATVVNCLDRLHADTVTALMVPPWSFSTASYLVPSFGK